VYYWISWYQPTEDYRPLTYPPNAGILGCWCTGVRADGASTLCAMVHANSQEQAEAIVQIDWPEAEEWRFCDETDLNLGDRFPVEEGSWQDKRFKAHKAG